MERPDLFDRTADPETWSNMAAGGDRLTWKEAYARQLVELERLRPLAATLSDLDRCEHGRHEGDVCNQCGGPSLGNPIMAANDHHTLHLDDRAGPVDLVDRQLGFDIAGRPLVVPLRGEQWDAS